MLNKENLYKSSHLILQCQTSIMQSIHEKEKLIKFDHIPKEFLIQI